MRVKKLKTYKEFFMIFVWFTALLILFIILKDMFEKSWAFEFKEMLLELEKETGKPVMDRWYALLMLASGFVLGSVLVTTIFDYKKRLNGILLSITATPLILINTETISKYFAAFAVGIVIGSAITYKTAERVMRNYLKCKIGTKSVFVFGLLAVALAVLFMIMYYYEENNTILNGDLMKYLLASGAFVYVLKKFSEQEPKTRHIMAVGPISSGKTVFMGACYDHVLKSDSIFWFPSKDLMEIHQILTSGEWPERTLATELREYEFTYMTSGVFKREIKLFALDYSGEHFENVVRNLKGEIPYDNLHEIARNVVTALHTAKYLMFLIPVRDLVENEAELRRKLADYIEVVKNLNKPYYLVATMCDALWEKDWEISEENYEKLEKKVFEKLKNIPEFKMLYDNCIDFKCVLVFETPEGNPMVAEHKLVSLGYDKVLEAI